MRPRGTPKVKTGRTTWSSDPASGTCPGGESGVSRRASHPDVHCASVTAASRWGTPRVHQRARRTERGASTQGNVVQPQNETHLTPATREKGPEDTMRRGRSHGTSTGPTHSRPPGIRLGVRGRRVGASAGVQAAVVFGGDRVSVSRVEWRPGGDSGDGCTAL